MKQCTKQMFVILFLFAFSIQSLTQTKYDVFPLKKGMHYTYNFYQKEETYMLTDFPVLIYTDSGKVEYTLIDSLKMGDTLTVWNTEQRRNLLYSYYVRSDSGYSLNDTSRTIDTSYFSLFESLEENHALRCSSMIWISPLKGSPNYFGNGLDTNFYRYSDSEEVVYKLSSPFQPPGVAWEDTIWFSEKAGMYCQIINSYANPGINEYYKYVNINRIDIPDKVEINKLINLNKYILFQNYPNPFNPTTKIKYQISETGVSTLKIYDVLGREIKTLIDEKKPAGNYEIEFNATGLPSGIYFYQLKAGNYIETKKMILMK